MCVNLSYSEVCDSNGVILSVCFEIHSARAIRTYTHIHTHNPGPTCTCAMLPLNQTPKTKDTDTERGCRSLEVARGPALCDVSDTLGDDDDCFYHKSALVPLILCAQICCFRFEIISGLCKTSFYAHIRYGHTLTHITYERTYTYCERHTRSHIHVRHRTLEPDTDTDHCHPALPGVCARAGPA